MSNLLNVSPENTGFYLNDTHLFYIFDIPHIIKALRNMLIKYDFYVYGKVISWQYIKAFYDNDKNFPIRSAHKLTESHINPSNFEKMKVKLATQIFSHSVYVGMTCYIRFGYLPAEAAETADFVERTDKLFDILNSSQTSSSKKYNAAFKGETYLIEFLTDCLSFFNKLEVRNKNMKNITKSMKISINSTIKLFNYLRTTAIFDYLFTKKLNQDCLENHFGKIRRENGNCINPTAIQFHRTFRKLQCVNLFHSGTENCEADLDAMLLRIEDCTEQTVLEEEKQENDTEKIITAEYSDEILQKNFVRYSK